MKEIEKMKKKNDINEMIIVQLKKELEKYAYKLIQLQERGAYLYESEEKNGDRHISGQERAKSDQYDELERTMSATQDDEEEGWQ